jgi:hypothetical protein
MERDRSLRTPDVAFERTRIVGTSSQERTRAQMLREIFHDSMKMPMT